MKTLACRNPKRYSVKGLPNHGTCLVDDRINQVA